MDNTEFKTPDPALTGYLFARGFELDKVEHERSQKVFVFALTPQLKQAVEDYSFNAPAPVRDVIGGYRRALNLIRSARQSDNFKIQESKNHVDVSYHQ